MSISVEWTGVDELYAILRALPDHLVGESAQIVMHHTDVAAADIKAAYPRTARTTGGQHLADAVKVDYQTDRNGAVGRVANRHPLAWIFEHGSAARYHNGAYRGSMPAGNVFIPRAIRSRRAMYEDLLAMVQREGLTVTSGGAPE